MNRFAFVALAATLALPQLSSAMELRGHVGLLAPTSTTMQKYVGSVSDQKNYDTKISFEVNAELLFVTPFAPFQYGAGLGYLSQEKTDKTEIVPNSMPVWAAIVLKSPYELLDMKPFIEARVGWALPLTTTGAWWEKPANLITKLSVGASLPGNVGITFDYTYTSFTKSYEYKDLKYKTSSNHFGGSIFVYFDIIHDRPYVPNTEVHEEDENN